MGKRKVLKKGGKSNMKRYFGIASKTNFDGVLFSAGSLEECVEYAQNCEYTIEEYEICLFNEDSQGEWIVEKTFTLDGEQTS